MGVKEVWNLLTPYCDRKPIHSLHLKTVAIDLAGWVCESLNSLDYFVNPKHYLRNLFCRTCYLIWEEITPVFVLEGTAPKLKAKTINKRTENQFRGVKPKEKIKPTLEACGRTKFNHVLRQCETLLKSMGLLCVQAPGEAEAYCAFLNKKGLVDGVISQDSDCFAYGAIRVYRNFSVSTRASLQGGFVDIYDMHNIRKSLDFGQHKFIAMALLCGCDYCPDGIGGIGRDGVMRLLNKYGENEILDKLRSFRYEDAKYTNLEMRANDKSICSDCGHLGKKQNHSQRGCVLCRTIHGCDESLWKEERLTIQAELLIRKEALSDTTFPSEDIIKEFLSEPCSLPELQLTWGQPNIVKFIKLMGRLLQWTEIYCFQKCFPILTRWHVRNSKEIGGVLGTAVVPFKILKKRTIKGVPNLVVIWKDNLGFFKGLIPEEQLKEFENNNINGLQDLWVTTEPLNLMKEAYYEIVQNFLMVGYKDPNINLASKSTKYVPDVAQVDKRNINNFGMQIIDKNLKNNNYNSPPKSDYFLACSTPNNKLMALDLESSNANEQSQNLSDIVNGIIIKENKVSGLSKHDDRALLYETIKPKLGPNINTNVKS